MVGSRFPKEIYGLVLPWLATRAGSGAALEVLTGSLARIRGSDVTELVLVHGPGPVGFAGLLSRFASNSRVRLLDTDSVAISGAFVCVRRLRLRVCFAQEPALHPTQCESLSLAVRHASPLAFGGALKSARGYESLRVEWESGSWVRREVAEMVQSVAGRGIQSLELVRARLDVSWSPTPAGPVDRLTTVACPAWLALVSARREVRARGGGEGFPRQWRSPPGMRVVELFGVASARGVWRAVRDNPPEILVAGVPPGQENDIEAAHWMVGLAGKMWVLRSGD